MGSEEEARTRWRFAAASVAGTSHEATGTPCQDATACTVVGDLFGQEVFLAVAADGAGSASHSELGSHAACDAVLDAVREHFRSGGDAAGFGRTAASAALRAARHRIDRIAAEAGLPTREFACTLVAAIVGTIAAAFFQVGDGVIVVSARDDADSFSWVFWPSRGEYANTTSFVTDPDAEDRMMFDTAQGAIDEVAVLTDGLQALVLDYRKQTAHAPYFRQMMAPLSARDDAGEIPDLSAALAEYLGSPRVNERTDDDKTLVLAVRRKSPAAEKVK